MADTPESPYLYADLSAAAYQSFDESSQMAAQYGYELDAELSNANRHVFHHPTTGKTVIAYRGTQIHNAGDLLTDAAIAAGFEEHTRRYHESQEVLKRAVQKYGKENIHLTGHSLGGSIALHLANEYGVSASVYNPAFTPLDVAESKRSGFHMRYGILPEWIHPDPAKQRNIHIFTTGVDPISALSLKSSGYSVFVVRPRSLNVHTIDNFTSHNRGHLPVAFTPTSPTAPAAPTAPAQPTPTMSSHVQNWLQHDISLTEDPTHCKCYVKKGKKHCVCPDAPKNYNVLSM